MPTTNLTEVEAVLDMLATPVVIWDLDGRVLASNETAAALFGYSRAQMRHVRRDLIVHPEDLQDVQARANTRRSGDRTRRRYAQRIVTAGGAVRQCACSAAAYEYDGQVIGTVVEYIDGTRLEQAGGAFARDAALFHELFELSPVAVYTTDADYRFAMVNPACRLLLQRPIEELQALAPREVIAPEYQDLFHDQRDARGGVDNLELEVLRPDGSRRWVRASVRAWDGPTGAFAGQVGVIQDITDQVAQRQAAEADARRDPLTGILNRRALDEVLGRRSEQPVALAVIDLNDFKIINDEYGHSVGDDALRAVAERLDAIEGVQAYRTGGDEFVLLACGWSAEQLEQAVPATVSVTGTGLSASLAVGVAVAEPGEAWGAALEPADERMYADKRAKRARHTALRRSA